MEELLAKIPGLGNMMVAPLPDGVRLGNMPPETMQSIKKLLGGTVKESGVGLDTGLASGYITNDWQKQRAGQGYYDAIREGGVDKFDAFAPEKFERIRKADAMLRKETKGRFTLSPVLDEVRAAVAGGGWKDLQKVATKYGIPLTLLVLGLRQAGEDVPEPDTASDAQATSRTSG